ncbi:MAG: hypothetical protein KF860_07085 [Cyclobacteriaceae bacterium]|nr:hypothetical protein [Cyclobacteriaceae bacterium]
MKIKYLSVLIIFGIFLAISCKDDVDPTVDSIKIVTPTLTTGAATNITITTATSGGEITDDGGDNISIRGICWSTTENPTMVNDKIASSAGTAAFSSTMEGLVPNTKYYVRAFASNSAGTGYGNQISFTTLQEIKLPILTTAEITDITLITASGGGEISSDGGSAITSKGLCWSTTQNPTIADSKTTNGTGTGNYTSALTGLIPNTTYYVRAYATNTVGTGYGGDVSFTTLDGIVDGDGNIYTTVAIGTQVWLQQNLKTTKYNNGDPIGTTDPVYLNIDTETSPKYQWAYSGEESNVTTNGLLYTWYAVTDSRGVCPSGWHLPTSNEWEALIAYLGTSAVAGGKLKEEGTTHWGEPNTGATNESGFTALPSGYRARHGNYYQKNTTGNFWSATETNIGNGTVGSYILNKSNSEFNYGITHPNNGLSARCLKG